MIFNDINDVQTLHQHTCICCRRQHRLYALEHQISQGDKTLEILVFRKLCVKSGVNKFIMFYVPYTGGRLPDPVERFVGGRSLLASSLLLSPLCHHGALAPQPE